MVKERGGHRILVVQTHCNSLPFCVFEVVVDWLRGNFGTRVPMGKEKKAKEKKGKEDKVVVVEFKVSMHCNACERTVAKAISKIKGVEKFVTDMTRHRVVITGKIKPEKVLKKLRKKTGKRVEIVSNKEDSKDPTKEGDSSIDGLPKDMITRSMVLGYCGDDYLYMMFSDENANACSIM